MDTRELHIAEPQLVELQRRAALGTLCAAIAHEAQSPLECASIVLRQAIHRLAHHVPASVDARMAKEIELALEAITLAENVLRDALELAAPSDIEGSTDLSSAIDDVLALLSPARPPNARVETRLTPGLRVVASRTHVQQIAMNLVQNAFHALRVYGEHGTVRVSTSATEHGVCQLVVEDDGPGIPPDVRRRLFQPFSGSRVWGEGTGLGLHVVKRITDMLGGSVALSPLDHGTKAVVELRKAKADAARGAGP